MAGQPKRGLDFAAWDVHLFDDDERFDVLIDAQGWDGFGVFFWICTKAYATNGYYYEWREETSAATIAKRMSGGIKSDTVNQVVKLCLRIGLFDNGLFDRESILTNKMMQERYMYAIEKRSVRGRTINRLYWLLKTEETKAYIVIPENEHNLSENEHNLSENDTKKSKVKESKENIKQTTFISLRLKNGFYNIPFSILDEYKKSYPSVDVETELLKISKYFEINSEKRKTSQEISLYINKWLKARSEKNINAQGRTNTTKFNHKTGEIVL